jgi:hypothetical protein
VPVRVRAACVLVLLTRSRKFWAWGRARSLFGALLSPIYRGSACGFAAAGCLDDAPINGDLAQVEADALVVGLHTLS